MAPKSMTRRMNKLLGQCSGENYETEETVRQGRVESNLFHPEIQHSERQFRVDDQYSVGVVNENPFMVAEGQCSQLFGQALHQRSKQGLVVTYEDSGDNL